MEPQTTQRRVWDIDKRLEALVGCAVRVRADVILPRRWNGEVFQQAIDGMNFSLPDGTRIDRDPMYVEGVLKEFRRSIAIVFVDLDDVPMEGMANGRVHFRGKSAVILRGPASVQLSYPYIVEKISTDMKSYWNDLVSSQFELGLE